jgi:hypothetical protein
MPESLPDAPLDDDNCWLDMLCRNGTQLLQGRYSTHTPGIGPPLGGLSTFRPCGRELATFFKSTRWAYIIVKLTGRGLHGSNLPTRRFQSALRSAEGFTNHLSHRSRTGLRDPGLRFSSDPLNASPAAAFPHWIGAALR